MVPDSISSVIHSNDDSNFKDHSFCAKPLSRGVHGSYMDRFISSDKLVISLISITEFYYRYHIDVSIA